MTTCPKCNAISGDDWSQCGDGPCPMGGPGVCSISYLTGTSNPKVRYWIVPRRIARWWWGHREEFEVHTDFMVLGGFKTRDDAHEAAKASGFVWVRGF